MSAHCFPELSGRIGFLLHPDSQRCLHQLSSQRLFQTENACYSSVKLRFKLGTHLLSAPAGLEEAFLQRWDEEKDGDWIKLDFDRVFNRYTRQRRPCRSTPSGLWSFWEDEAWRTRLMMLRSGPLCLGRDSLNLEQLCLLSAPPGTLMLLYTTLSNSHGQLELLWRKTCL